MTQAGQGSLTAAGREVEIVWRGRRARAFVPVPLAERDLSLQPTTVARTARAEAQLVRSAADLPADYLPLARLMLRAEGVASSYIEGVAAPVLDVVVAEQADGAADGTPAAWVAANLAAITDAVAAAQETPLTVPALGDWHATLMAGSPTPGRFVGRLRDEQGWIGGTSPFDAALVTPPPERVPELLEDLVAYANRTDVDPVAQAAVAHAQFEVVHPFADGNGRVGRLLVAWVLVRRLSLLTAPPVSTRIAADVGGYSSGLTLFRLGRHDEWVRWFADAVSGAGEAQQELVREVHRLQEQWRRRLAALRPGGRVVRSDGSAWRLLELLPRHLLLSATLVASELDVSVQAATNALRLLADAGVLRVVREASAGRGRPHRVYASVELLALAGATALR